MFIETLFLFASLVITLLFFLYGFNHYYLLFAARKYIPPTAPAHLLAYRPRVAIHLPVYNEKYVIHRLIGACAQIAAGYGLAWVKIVIIDDSDDDTVEIINGLVEEYTQKGLQIEVLRRGSRQGFKSGALQAALDRTDEEFIVIFDADFFPEADFLERTLPFFALDENLGIIQTRWAHINRDYNLLTRAISIGIDVHFLIEQTGRYAAGCFQNFNGSGGILRKKALQEAGGWQADTLAEDLDASYRIQLQGYKVLFLRDLTIPGEIPSTVPSYKKQQGRWACGSLRTAKKLLPTLLKRRNLSLKKRLESFIHLTSYLVHPLMFATFILACLATLLHVKSYRVIDLNIENLAAITGARMHGEFSLNPQYLVWGLLGLMIILCTVAAWIPPILTLRAQSLPVSSRLASFVVLFFLGCGVSLSNTIEAGKALFTNRDWSFRRTPKYALKGERGDWRDKRYQVDLDFVCYLELACAALGLLSIFYSLWSSNYGILVILVPLTAAYGFVSILTILESQPELKV